MKINNVFGLGQRTVHPLPENLFEVRITRPNKSKQEIKMKQLKEIWKPIKNYEGLYEISNFGRTKSLPKSTSKSIFIMKTNTINSGYFNMRLCKNGIHKAFLVHYLVYTHFINNTINKTIFQIDHIDENKQNNRIDNLQLLTRRRNTAKSFIYKGNKTSKYTGVSRHKQEKWVSQIKINGEIKRLGRFKDEYKAHLAYQKELKK